MPDNQRFPIPDELEPETYCLCIPMPNDSTWKQTIVGLLAQPTYWFNWDRDEARSGRVLAAYWTKLFDQIEWGTMSCCCNQPPAIFRYGAGGVYQMSVDGGLTWVDAPNYDFRNTSTTFPDPADLGITNTKCQAADGVVVTVNGEIVQALNDTFAAAQILALIAAVLLAVLSAGSLAALTPLITAIGAAILDVGVAATQAAFTSDVLDRFRCYVFNNMNSDSSIDAAGLAGLLSDISSGESGIVETILYGIVNAAGVVGITNMIRSNKGDPDANCDDCDTSPHVYQWDLVADPVEIFADGDGIYTAVSGSAFSGHYNIAIIFGVPYDSVTYLPCNNITDVSYDTNEPSFRPVSRCHDGVDDPLSSCNASILRRGTLPWTWTFTLDDDEPCV